MPTTKDSDARPPPLSERLYLTLTPTPVYSAVDTNPASSTNHGPIHSPFAGSDASARSMSVHLSRQNSLAEFSGETSLTVLPTHRCVSQDTLASRGLSQYGALQDRLGATEATLPTTLRSDSDDSLSSSSRSSSGDDQHVRFRDTERTIEDEYDSADDSDYHDDTHTNPRYPNDSPYPEVRGSVPPTDNTKLSINTPRMWILSMLFSILGSSVNLFFSLRYPSVAMTPVIALLLVHPLGLVWDYCLKRPADPVEEFVDGSLSSASHRCGVTSQPSNSIPAWDLVGYTRAGLEHLRLWLAQGRWNEKEHACVYVSSNVAFGFAFATDVIVEQTQFYKQDVTLTYQLLLTLSTQILGYAFAGLSRRFLVRPSGMIWPGTLMSAAMFDTLHKDKNKPADGWTVSRWRFFLIVSLCGCAFYFLPGLLFPALSFFSVVTWFAPDNVVVANLFGVVSGLGPFPLTFDWAQIAYIGSPLLTPFWAAMNVIGGLVLVMWFMAPVVYYGNIYYTSYMPMSSASVYDNTGKIYNVSRILTPEFLLDKEAYKNYSRVFLPATYVLSYGLQFAGLAALITHTVCWHGKDIIRQWGKVLEESRDIGFTQTNGSHRVTLSTSEADSCTFRSADGAAQPLVAGATKTQSDPAQSSTAHAGRWTHETSRAFQRNETLLGREDIHNRLMKRYADAPAGWYLLTFIVTTATGMFIVEYYPVHLPWYGVLLALSVCAVLFIPTGIVMAVTNQHTSIYLICQLICGSVFPGRPVANMVFVTYGYISSAQGIKFAADLKLGHYMKVPPRIMFAVQMVATCVAGVIQIIVLNWMFANVEGLCTPAAVNGFTCPIARVHFNGSILWGVLGPAEFFGPGAIYSNLVWCFVLGAAAPVLTWGLYRWQRRPRRWLRVLRRVNFPVVFGSLSWIPPATGLNFSVWAIVCYVFNHVVKRRRPAWWAKYAMTLSAALDSGLAVGIVLVFFGFVYPSWQWLQGLRWWGTEVFKMGCDWKACAFRTVGENERFGPKSW